MPVLSKPDWSVFPDEIERMIFLFASREPHELANYVLVAPRVRYWLQPILYRKITILDDTNAKCLISSLTTQHKTIIYLYLGISVQPSTAERLLPLCPQLVNLVLCAGGNSLCQHSMVREAINKLTHLKYLSVNPVLLFNTHSFDPPSVSVFRQITHLDLSTHWTWEAVTNGFQFLYSMTHLAISWRHSRHGTGALQSLLRQKGFRMIILWRDDFETHPLVVENLVSRGLDDLRIIVLHRGARWARRCGGEFWLHGARVIAWRMKNNLTTVQRPYPIEDLVIAYHDIVVQEAYPWEHD